MTRDEEIKEAAVAFCKAEEAPIGFAFIPQSSFIVGALWADSHPHWISVEDELPPLEIVSESWETSDDVLVYTLSGDMLVSRYEFSKLTKEHYWIFSDHDYIVTHWMPLPQPPAKLSSLERTGKKWKEKKGDKQ